MNDLSSLSPGRVASFEIVIITSKKRGTLVVE